MDTQALPTNNLDKAGEVCHVSGQVKAARAQIEQWISGIREQALKGCVLAAGGPLGREQVAKEYMGFRHLSSRDWNV